MKDMLMKKLMKSSESAMPKAEKMGKMEALKQLIQEMNSLMGGDLESGMEDPMDAMQKVTVAAPDKESLMKGLDKAEDVLEDMPLEGFGKELASKEDEDEEDMF